jgi:hypothetical protein
MEERLEQVLDAHIVAIQSALAANNVQPPGRVERAWPSETYLTGIVQPIAGNVPNAPVVALTPVGNGTPKTRWKSTRVGTVTPVAPATITATLDVDTVTFSGTIAEGINIALFVGAPPQAIVYQTIEGDTLASLPSTLAENVNAAGIVGVTAIAAADAVIVTGPNLACNVGATGTILRENGRFDQRVQVTVYAADGATRGAILGAIQANIGTTDPATRWIRLPDGTTTFTRLASTPMWRDESIAGSMLKRGDLFFMIEYGVVAVDTISQVVAMGVTLHESLANVDVDVTAGGFSP